MTDNRSCLHCGETKASLKAQRITMCAIEGGYEYREIEHEFARHRWADWRDRELDLMGIKPEAYEKHRRTPALHIQWVGCEDTKRGHVPATRMSDWADYGCRIGQCIACGQVPGSNEPPQGWFAFGTHVDTPGRLEFSEALGDDGMPKWERPAPGSSVRGSEVDGSMKP